MDRMNIESIDPNIDCDAEDYAYPRNSYGMSLIQKSFATELCVVKTCCLTRHGRSALDDYLKRNLKIKLRNPEQKQKHKTATISLAEKLATAFPQGNGYADEETLSSL